MDELTVREPGAQTARREHRPVLTSHQHLQSCHPTVVLRICQQPFLLLTYAARKLEIRDLYNNEDAFRLAPAYLDTYRARVDANLAFYDRLDGDVAWPATSEGGHPLTDMFLADFLVVDISRPHEEGSFLEIEQALLRGEEPRSCGGRWLDDDIIDTLLTLLINGGAGPRIRDGVDEPSRNAARTFPFLAPPNPAPGEFHFPSASPTSR
ncbi:hypothetical protein ACIQVT_11875 [Streptomyces sp. NPDC100445]|uniref:hypothetical protein n=1 Tax=Streptomyces sp. NPDC100445 TaxID=3366102 RepID=UPI00381E962A